jgi:hypothetical protein
MTKISTKYFQGEATREDLNNGRASLLIEALVDEDDSGIVTSMCEEDVDFAYTLWVLANG